MAEAVGPAIAVGNLAAPPPRLLRAEFSNADWVPLIQEGIAILIAIVLSFIFRDEISLFRVEMKRRLKEGGALKFGSMELGQVKREVSGLRDEVDHLNAKVADLFLLTMSPTMYLNLQKLESGHFGPYKANEGLRRELRHLRDLGYIEVRNLTGLPPIGADLNHYVSVTPTGREFVRLRQSLPRADE